MTEFIKSNISILDTIDKIDSSVGKPIAASNNENDNQSLYPGRIFRDTATSTYAEGSFLSTIEHRTAFIDFTYHTLNTNLQIFIDYELEKNDYLPLSHNEFVELYYKGGNIMNFHFSKLRDRMENCASFFNKELYEKNKTIFDDLSKNFKVSDVDYTAYIFVDSEERHNQVQKCVTKILASALMNITNYFDGLMQIDERENRENIVPVLLCDQSIDGFDTNVDPSGKVGNILFNSLGRLIEILTQVKKESNPVRIEQIIKEVNQFVDLETANSLDINELNYLYNIYYYVRKSQYTNNIRTINCFERIKAMIYDKLLAKSKRPEIIDFYHRKDFNLKTFKELLAVNLNKINKDQQYYDFGDKIVVRSKDISADDIYYKSRSNIVTEPKHQENNPKNLMKITLDNMIKNHYLSLNTTIYTKSPALTLHFDLLRSKFSISAKGITNMSNNLVLTQTGIPSEFIDISIAHYDDSSFVHFKNQHYGSSQTSKTFVTICAPNESTNVNIFTVMKGYTLENVADDLSFVLFTQRPTPWTDAKYDKRINRLFLFAATIINMRKNDRAFSFNKGQMTIVKSKTDDIFETIDKAAKVFRETTESEEECINIINEIFGHMLKENNGENIFGLFETIKNYGYDLDYEIIYKKLVKKYMSDEELEQDPIFTSLSPLIMFMIVNYFIYNIENSADKSLMINVVRECFRYVSLPINNNTNIDFDEKYLKFLGDVSKCHSINQMIGFIINNCKATNQQGGSIGATDIMKINDDKINHPPFFIQKSFKNYDTINMGILSGIDKNNNKIYISYDAMTNKL